MRACKSIFAIFFSLICLGGVSIAAQKSTDSAAVSQIERAVADGYLDAYIAEYSDGARLVRGPRYHIVSVAVNDTVQAIEGRPVASEDTIDRFRRRAVERLQSNGNYFARARLEAIDKREGEIDVRLRVVPGPQVAMGQVVIEGLTRSDERQVRRYLRIVDTQLVTPSVIEDLARRAGAIEYLTFVAPIELRVQPGYTTADLAVVFQEKQQVRIAGGGGYSPDDDAGLVWHLDLALTNLFGGGRRVGVRSARPDRGRSLLDINYSQPAFLLGVDRLSIDVATRLFRDDFYEFGVNGEYRSRLSPGFALSLRPGWRRVEPNGIPAGYSAYRIGLGAERSTLDQPLNPKSGYRLATAIDYVHRRYSDDTLEIRPERNSFNETRTRLDIEGYQSLLGDLVGKIAFTYEGYESEQALPPLAELILIGGPGSIRGYRTEQFAVRRAAYGSVEPRYRFANGYVFVFYDGAYLNRTLTNFLGEPAGTEERFESSVGFGLALAQSGRSLAVSFGWAKDAALDQPRLAIELRSDL